MVKTWILDRVKGKPEVIIIGERHANEYHQKIEARLIKMYKSEFIFSEGVDTSEKTKNELNDFKKFHNLFRDYILKIPLKDIAIKYGLDVEALFRSYSNETHLLYKPLGELTSEEIVDIRMNIFLIKLDLLKDLDMSENIQSILERSKSNIEKVQRIEKIEGVINTIWQYKDRLPVFEAVYDVGATILGYDVDFSKAPRLNNNAKNPAEYGKKFDEFAKNSRRGYIMARSIEKYIGKTKKPIIAIVGQEHLEEGSKLLEMLDEIGINQYRVIELPGREKPEKNLLYRLLVIDTFNMK